MLETKRIQNRYLFTELLFAALLHFCQTIFHLFFVRTEKLVPKQPKLAKTAPILAQHQQPNIKIHT